MEKVKYKQYVHSSVVQSYVLKFCCFLSEQSQYTRWKLRYELVVPSFPCFLVLCCCVSLVQYVQTRVTSSVNFPRNSLISLSVRN